MANIQKKELRELSEDAQDLIKRIDKYLNHNQTPIVVYNFEINEEDLCDVMKYLIDTGWFSSNEVYARKIEYTNKYREHETGLFIDDIENYYKYYEEQGIYYFPKNFPEIIAVECIHGDNQRDGNIYLRINNQVIAYRDWDNFKKTYQKRKTNN